MPVQDKPYINVAPYWDTRRGLRTSLTIDEGIIKLVGPAGSGKTTLCRRLANELSGDDGQLVVFIGSPPASAAEMERVIAGNLSLGDEGNFTRRLSDYLIHQADLGRKLVVIFDDAQNVDDDTLLAIRMLANIQNESEALVKLVLCGDEELERRLGETAQRATVQHISQSFTLAPMSVEEFEEFALRYLREKGSTINSLDRKVCHTLFRQSGGLPGRSVELLDEHRSTFDGSPGESATGARAGSAGRRRNTTAEFGKKLLKAVVVVALALAIGAALWFMFPRLL